MLNHKIYFINNVLFILITLKIHLFNIKYQIQIELYVINQLLLYNIFQPIKFK